jgi:hypothetical protein
MNSYINLILEAEGAKERLQSLFHSAPEQSAAEFFDSRHRSGADRAHKHSVFAAADSPPCSQAGKDDLVAASQRYGVMRAAPVSIITTGGIPET